MLDFFAAVPPLTPLLHFVGDILRTGYPDRRNERETLVQHIRRIISVLDSALMSSGDSGLDTVWILNLRTKLAHMLEKLTPKNRSILRRVRARWICHERFIHETNREIDGVLRLIELHTVVSLNGGVASLRGEVGQLMRDARLNSSTPPAHNTVCECGASRGPADRGYVSRTRMFSTTVAWLTRMIAIGLVSQTHWIFWLGYINKRGDWTTHFDIASRQIEYLV
ncbi:unnamed protein product [Rhizoctonia solani]|uniref:Uncharacterized protein n=1 Tax=Rhizoctonia solani TaxID=456999 RepID=A0A8H3D8E3_9AGAM|nr:unnamed protein product [Rhizoctonia solani]